MAKSQDTTTGGAMPAQGQTSRRLFLDAGSAAAVFATVKHAAGGAGPVDPIFAAIERHKAAWAAFREACDLTDEVRADHEGREVTEADEAAYEVCNKAEQEALDALFALPPITLAGMRAAIQWIVEYDCGCMETASDFLPTLLDSPLLAEGA
jgi:hypothetical protein